MIRAEHLTKDFGRVRAVDDVSFEVRQGEVVGFLGPNGAGKTTTLRMLAGVFPPTAGRASIRGRDTVTDALVARRHHGYFPEHVALYQDMTVDAYLHHVAAMKDVSRAERPHSVAAAMAACGATGVARRHIGTLSRGFRQRVGLAQALLGSPAALLLDEPTTGLDPEQVVELRTLIRAIARERAVLLSSHVLAEVELLCDRVVILGGGRVLAIGTPADGVHRLRATSQVVIAVVDPDGSVLGVVRAVPGVRDASPLPTPAPGVARLCVSADPERDVRPDLVRALVRAGIPVLEVHAQPLSLEDAFLALVGRCPPRLP